MLGSEKQEGSVRKKKKSLILREKNNCKILVKNKDLKNILVYLAQFLNSKKATQSTHSMT